MKHGIAFAGNLLADNVKTIDVWPEQGMLCNIRKIAPGVGGLVPNTCGSLALVDPSVPLYAVGLEYKFFVMLSRLLPIRTIGWLLGLLYSGK